MIEYKNADIKSKEEAVERLEAGEVFYALDNYSNAIKIRYEKDYIFKGESPFRIGLLEVRLLGKIHYQFYVGLKIKMMGLGLWM